MEIQFKLIPHRLTDRMASLCLATIHFRGPPYFLYHAGSVTTLTIRIFSSIGQGQISILNADHPSAPRAKSKQVN